ncbi:MAG TPA: hypothetical protein VFU47_02505, partial [Armatimonadota bacterium]|nr:hypothetical protein [Armatimonadota bacterium]
MKRRRRRVLMACSRAAGSTLPASTLDYVARYTPEGVYADAGGTTRPANGGTVALWRDAGPVGYDLTVTGAAPTWDSTAGYLGQTNGGTFPNLNPFGVPTATGGVKFNGSTQGLANAAFNAVPNTTSPITVAVVCRALVGGSAGPAVGLGSNGAYMSYLPSRAGGDEWNTYKPSGGGGIYNPNRPDTGRVFVFVFDPAGGTFAAKGKLWEFGAAQVVSGASYPNPGAISAGLRFGSDTVFPHFFSGYLWEVIIWNRALTATEQAAVGNYLADKYVRTGYRHLYCGGDSLTRGYPSSQDDNPATSGGGDDSYPHQLWSLLEARGPGHWSFRNDGQTAYTVGTGIAGSPGSVQN